MIYKPFRSVSIFSDDLDGGGILLLSLFHHLGGLVVVVITSEHWHLEVWLEVVVVTSEHLLHASVAVFDLKETFSFFHHLVVINTSEDFLRAPLESFHDMLTMVSHSSHVLLMIEVLTLIFFWLLRVRVFEVLRIFWHFS